MKKELKKYLYQTNHTLLSTFKQGSQGESHFYEFMTLIREELVPKETISMTREEAEKIKEDIKAEFGR